MISKIWPKSKPILTKAALEPLILPAIVILVGLSAFALGRLSAMGEGSQLPVVTNPGR